MGLSDQTIAVMKMKGITMDTMLDLLAPLPPSESQQNIDLNQKLAGDSVFKIQRKLGVTKEFSQPRKIQKSKVMITKETIELEKLQKRPNSKSKIKRSDTSILKRCA